MNTFDFLPKTPSEIQLLLAARIRKIRKKHKLSQKELARKADVSFGSIQRFEQQGEISLASFIKITIVLDLSKEVEALFENMPILSIEEIINGKY